MPNKQNALDSRSILLAFFKVLSNFCVCALEFIILVLVKQFIYLYHQV